MATVYKTPGVYIQELNAFPNSVVEVATAVPAFLGYTQTQPTPNVPTRISSLAEFTNVFGGPPKIGFTYTPDSPGPGFSVAPVKASQFLLYAGMRLFFDNGGGPCWIVSIGTYASAAAAKSANDFLKDLPLIGLPSLKKIQEPTMLVAPDAVLLDRPGWESVCQQMLMHCDNMQSRISILDVFEGWKERTNTDDTDVITLFRDAVTDNLNYGQAYYPWLNTSIFDDTDVDFTLLDSASLTALKAALNTELANVVPPLTDSQQTARKALNASILGTFPPPITSPPASPPLPTSTQVHLSLWQVSKVYKDVMKAIKDNLNLQPPSAAMAGVYTRVDDNIGVFKAPANTGLASVIKPCVNITSEEQEDLNVPLNGKAVNAIRAFPGSGVLVWGARTLEGNSQDWRYINVRRTIIMLEQSIKYACQAYVFEPNNASTWVTVKNMISNFLTNQWKSGALVGAKPEEAFSVDIGLGSTMTADDILDGYMRVTVKVAIVRPAEFIVLTFQQKMQTS